MRQTGAVCHDGYSTCYYRQLGDDGALIAVRERAFDPESVYGSDARPKLAGTTPTADRIVDATRRQFGAYAHLRDSDLSAYSATSRCLRSAGDDLGNRVADELRELAGVLNGSHRHSDVASDLRLEASQALYWVIVEALRRGVTWAELRPDTALAVDDVGAEPGVVARLLDAEADRWMFPGSGDEFAAKAHATLALVALACRSGGLDPVEAVEADLAELRARPYMAGYFGQHDGEHGQNTERARASAG